MFKNTVLLFIVLSLFSCVSAHYLVVPEEPEISFFDRADFDSTDLFIDRIVIKGLTSSDLKETVHEDGSITYSYLNENLPLFKQSVIDFIKASNNFRSIIISSEDSIEEISGESINTINNTNDINQQLTLNLMFEPSHTAKRTIIFDILTVYPGAGFMWPFNPVWGDINVKFSAAITNGEGEVVYEYRNVDETPYSMYFYTHFNKKRFEKKLAFLYKEILNEFTEDLRQNKDSILRTSSISSPEIIVNDSFESVKPMLKKGNNYALVIGINEYENFANLNTAVKDADVISSILKEKYNFDVQKINNASRSDILNAISKYRSFLSEEDNFMIYYAGHGWLDEKANRGYWFPTDATENSPVNWIANDDLTAEIRAMNANHVLVVSDSCYSGTLTRGITVAELNPKHIEALEAKKARTVLTSGGIETVSDSGFYGHSVFAWEFIKALKNIDEPTDMTSIFPDIRRGVLLNSDQTPDYSDIRMAGHEGGDFIFFPNN